MSKYEVMRHFADSWMLLAFTLFFLGIVVFVFRAGSGKQYEEAARIPLEDENEV